MGNQRLVWACPSRRADTSALLCKSRLKSRLQAMTLDIVFDIQGRLLGVPQTPDRALCVRSNTPDGVALPLPAVAPSCTSAQEIRGCVPRLLNDLRHLIADLSHVHKYGMPCLKNMFFLRRWSA